MEEEPEPTIQIRLAVAADVKYVYPILEEMERSARARGTGIARRTPQSLCQKIYEGKAVIAIATTGSTSGGKNGMAGGMTSGETDVANGKINQWPDRANRASDGTDIEEADRAAREEWAGFSYVETWSDGKYVSNSGLIVNPVYRQAGVATAIKKEIFALSRRRYPGAQIFSITTGAAVMKLNHKFGFEPVTYSEITRQPAFWDQCRHCVNYSILESNERKICLCTAMLFTPDKDTLSTKFFTGSNDMIPKERIAGTKSMVIAAEEHFVG
jgi:hypothetical protein